MNTKEIASIVIATVTIVGSIIGWIEVQHQELATKSDLQFMYIETQMGINDIRLRSFEMQGLVNLSETDKRVYDALLEAQKSLEERRAM